MRKTRVILAILMVILVISLQAIPQVKSQAISSNNLEYFGDAYISSLGWFSVYRENTTDIMYVARRHEGLSAGLSVLEYNGKPLTWTYCLYRAR